MPIHSIKGDIISRRDLTGRKQGKKKRIKTLSKIKKNLIHTETMTAEKAKYIYDMNLARRLRDITRED